MVEAMSVSIREMAESLQKNADKYRCNEDDPDVCAKCLLALWYEEIVYVDGKPSVELRCVHRYPPEQRTNRHDREPWMGSPNGCAICGHGPAAMVSPFESFVCWGSDGVRPESPTDMHLCERAWMEGCKSEWSDDRRENERRIVERAHAWYAANAERERPYVAQAARESSAEFRTWRAGQTGIATGVMIASDSCRERLRRMVQHINWYEKNVEGKRGPDPRILLMGDVLGCGASR